VTWQPCPDCDREEQCRNLLVLSSSELKHLDGWHVPYCVKLYQKQLHELAVYGRVSVKVDGRSDDVFGYEPDGPATPCEEIEGRVRPKKK